MTYLVDSDTCSAYLRNQRKVTARFLQYAARIAVSAVTAGELFAWAGRSGVSPQRAAGVERLLAGLPILPVDEGVARRFGEVRSQLLDAGRPAPGLDLMIAATALHHSVTLVTHDVRDFTNVPGLTVVDWLAP